MLDRKTLRFRGFTDSSVKTIGSAPEKAFNKGLWLVDGFSAPTLLLWAILSRERSIALAALEAADVDVEKLRDAIGAALDVDVAAHRVVLGTDNRIRDANTLDPLAPVAEQLPSLFEPLLADAQKVASELGHSAVGEEHLLLSCIRGASNDLGSILTRFGIVEETVRANIETVLRSPIA